jgi:hypothetical protein
MTTDQRYEALRERHLRLRRAAEAVVEQAEAVGTRQQPMCGVKPHLIRNLRRELAHEPQPSGFFTMSVS